MISCANFLAQEEDKLPDPPPSPAPLIAKLLEANPDNICLK